MKNLWEALASIKGIFTLKRQNGAMNYSVIFKMKPVFILWKILGFDAFARTAVSVPSLK